MVFAPHKCPAYSTLERLALHTSVLHAPHKCGGNGYLVRKQKLIYSDLQNLQKQESETFTGNKEFILVAQSCGKKIGRTAIGQFQTATKFCHCSRKISYSEISLFDPGKQLFQLFLTETTGLHYAKCATGKIRNQKLRGIKMAVGMQFLHLIYIT